MTKAEGRDRGARRNVDAFGAWLNSDSGKMDAAPAELRDIASGLRKAGLLTSPLVGVWGGYDLAHPEQWALLCDTLQDLGAADLSAARLFEGHVNASMLVRRYGTSMQDRDFSDRVAAGALAAVWGADDASGLQAVRENNGFTLKGRKIFASGAGVAGQALVTANSDEGLILLLIEDLPSARVDLSQWTPVGMRDSATGSVDLTGLHVPAERRIGQAADFLRQPHFSGGAWRFCAAHLGAATRLVDLLRAHLVARGRDQDPYQLQRVADCVTAVTTASFWVRDAARRLAEEEDPERTVAFANLTRGVTERAALDVLEAVQRGIGLGGFLYPHPAERLMRDLATYLRQPVPDLAMADGARMVLRSDRTTARLWDQ